MYSLKIPEINKLLNILASHITDAKFQEMKFLLTDLLSPVELEQCRNPRDVFTKLKHRCLIREHNLEFLENLFNAMDLDNLTVKVQEFKNGISSVNDIPEPQTAALPAPRHALVTLLINQAYAEFNLDVIAEIRQTISQALRVEIGRVTYLFTRPYNSYYMCFQLPEESMDLLLQAANSEHHWLGNLHCLEVQINDSTAIRLQHHQESMNEPDSMQVDASDPHSDNLVTDGSPQVAPFCRYQEKKTVQVTFTFRGSRMATEVTVEDVDIIKLNLCANLNCDNSTQIHYIDFNSGPNIYHMTFLVPQCYFETLDCCCKELKGWLEKMNIFEIHTRNVSSGTMTAIYRCCR